MAQAPCSRGPDRLLRPETRELARFDKPGHRVTGDRTQNSRCTGWQALHVAIDDQERVCLRAGALRYDCSPDVKVERIMTHSGWARTPRRFAELLRRLGIRHVRTRPHTPRTNGKAERFIQTLLRE